MTHCRQILSVHLSVTVESSVKMVEEIEQVFGTKVPVIECYCATLCYEAVQISQQIKHFQPVSNSGLSYFCVLFQLLSTQCDIPYCWWKSAPDITYTTRPSQLQTTKLYTDL